MASGFRKFF